MASALAASASLSPELASAHWNRVSATPSSSSPYHVCPRRAHRARCTLIQDPTRGTNRRGPVPQGAITKGPVQEVSPAVYGTGMEGGYSPGDLRSAYALPSSGGSGQTVAVVDAYDDPKAEADLKTYRSTYGLPECTEANECFRKVNQTGGTSYPSPNGEWAREISLDLDMVSAICPSCHILLVEASSNLDSNLAAAEREAAKLGATEISNSFYGSEEEPEEASAYDHPGISIAAASGDEGFGVASPADYPSVIAVGGTALQPAGGRRGWAETVWGQKSGEGTGSGCSSEAKPAWQTDSGCAGRTTNDIAGVADPNTPVSAYDTYPPGTGWLLLGGTSVSTPIVSAAMALASAYTRSFEGAQGLYLQAIGGPGFNDITSGLNGGCGNYLCEAGPGYDGPSGLGSLRGAPEVPPPTVVTGSASAVGQTSVTLAASVNTHGAEVHECYFQYGPPPAYGSSVPCSSLPAPGTSPVPVSATVAGLSAASLYHYRIAVGYTGGPALGNDATFATIGYPPTVLTGSASAVASSSLTLNAQVNPNGATVDECAFEYGSTTSYGHVIPCAASPGGGNSPVAVSADVGGLAAASTLHYRALASNPGGPSYGSDQTATLLPLPPAVVTGAPSALTQSSATLNATVDPMGAALTACEFEFNSAGAYVPCAALPGAQGGPAAVSAAIAGLPAGTTFRYRIIAASAGGTSYGAIEEFASLLPPALAPAPAPTPSAPAASGSGAAQAVLTGRTLMVSSRGWLALRLRCASAEPRCRGTVRLRTLGAVLASGRARHKKSVLTLATARFAAGHTGTAKVRVRLSATARALLARTRRLRARATVLTLAGGGTSGRSETLVTLRAARHRR